MKSVHSSIKAIVETAKTNKEINQLRIKIDEINREEKIK